MKKRIVLIVKGEEAKEILESQLKAYFEPYCSVQSYLIDQKMEDMNDVDMVLFSSRSADIYQTAQRYIPNHVPTWILHRLFEPRRLKVLMQIPSGTEVLVINNLYGTCQEVIQTLLEAHMDHLIYVPFYPGGILEHEQYRYAITLGTPEVIPPGAVELIDIGIRHIHVHDLIELGRRLGVPLEREKQYLSTFIADIHEMGKELGKSFVDIQNLHTHLHSIFEAVQEPIFAVDQYGNITFINQMASDLFQCQTRNWMGQPISQQTGMDVILPFIQPVHSTHEALVTIKEQHFIVNCKRMERNQEYQGTVCMLKNVTEIQSLERRLRKAIVDKGHVASYTFDQIVGQSPSLIQAISKAKKMAKNNRSILITGENGTGKELFAHSIHQESPRCNGPFVAINCASFPENLLESEIFGYEEGAFTGARKGGKPGVFEIADGGTIFLDEIGDISPAIQVRLLRVLQEKQVVRVGATNVLSVDVRVIAATNKNLEEAVKQGRFREDLYYRLNVLPIEIPPLRERKDDIPLLLQHHLNLLGEQRAWSDEVLQRFWTYDWPGNIRELINVVEYVVTVSESPTITIEDIPEKLRWPGQKPHERNEQPALKEIELSVEEREILRILDDYDQQNRSVGRYELVQRPELERLGLTEQRLRTRMRKLEKMGLVHIGATKQGSQLTSKGKRLVKLWEHS